MFYFVKDDNKSETETCILLLKVSFTLDKPNLKSLRSNKLKANLIKDTKNKHKKKKKDQKRFIKKVKKLLHVYFIDI